MTTCDVLNCGNRLIEFFLCSRCDFKMCDKCADNLFINGKQICPKCTFGGNFEGLFPGISRVRFVQDHGTGILSTHQGKYTMLSDTEIYKYAVYMTRTPNKLILVFRLNDGEGERFMQFSLFFKGDSLMVRLYSPLNIIAEKHPSYNKTDIKLSVEETFNPNPANPIFSSLTPEFKIVFDTFKTESIKAHFDTEPIFGANWWKSMVGLYGNTYIDYGDDASASAASPFRPRKSQRRRSKSAKKRRNLKNKSKSKSKKRSPKSRQR